MKTDYHLERPVAQLAVWTPIFNLLDGLLKDLGLRPNPTSSFRVFAHTDRSKTPSGSLYLMQMHLAGLYSVDTSGWGVHHSLCADRAWENEPLLKALAFCHELASEWCTTGASKNQQPALAPPEWSDYVLVPLQIPDDCVVTDHSPVSVQEFVRQVSTWSAETRTRVLMKVHPGHLSRGPEAALWATEAAKASPYLKITSGNIHSLIARCRAVLVINSGVGFEALVHGKPVITIGRCDYDHVTTHGTLQTLPMSLEHALSTSPTDGFRFAYHYLFSRCYWPSRDPHVCDRLKRYLSAVVACS